jgi:hypothetical protein
MQLIMEISRKRLLCAKPYQIVNGMTVVGPLGARLTRIA